MKRSQILLSALAAIMVVALFYVLLFQPSRDELATIEASIINEQATQQTLTTEINRLRAVREQAPEVEAQLVAAEAIVPREAGLPSALRQLQVAADESGVVLASVTTGRPALLEGETDGLSSVDTNVQLEGQYFQVVDFLRRLEDPTISPRGLDWNNATVARNEGEYPALQVILTGRLYALISMPPPETEQAPVVDGEAQDGDLEEGVEPEADVEIDSEDAS